MTNDPIHRCPVDHGRAAEPTDIRKTTFGQHHTPGVEQIGDVWHLRSYAAVRQVLRDAEGVRQGIENDNPLFTRLRQPVIFLDGAPHREQRAAIARFFTPKTVGSEYQGIIEHYTDTLLNELERHGQADLSDLSMQLAMAVAARVIGLTDSRRSGIGGRLDRLLAGNDLHLTSPLARFTNTAGSLARMLQFYLLDVRPAIQARRKAPQEDVISHLIGKGYNDLEILIECLTYGAAGMATTREFICVAAWHLLEDGTLRETYLNGDQRARHQLLHELLRLEPVASTLWRTASRDLQIEDGGQTHTVPAGARMLLDIRTANIDPAAVGTEALEACPHRSLPTGVPAPVASFGDGAHRCPGAFLAIEESDLFLRRLLRLPVQLKGTPELTFNTNLKSYELRDVRLVLQPQAQGVASD